MTQNEFYDQRKWMDQHREADQLIAAKDGTILCAVYKSPTERVREDTSDFIEVLLEWSKTVELT